MAKKRKTAKKAAAPERAGVIERPAGKVEDFRPVRAGTDRAVVIEMGVRGTHTVEQVAGKLKKDRRTVLTILFLLNRDCAIGYKVEGDAMRVVLPRGKTASDAIKKQV